MTQTLTWPPDVRWSAEDPANQCVQGSLALSYPLPGGLDAEPRATALTLVRDEPGSTDPLPAVEPWAARFLQGVVEVISSDRPLSQLVRWTSEQVYVDVGRRQRAVAARRRPTAVPPGRHHVATVHVSRPSRLCAEVAARVVTGSRSRALAARFEVHRGRWVCTAITIG